MALDEFGFLMMVYRTIRGIRDNVPAEMFEQNTNIDLKLMTDYIGERLENIAQNAIMYNE